MRSPKHIAALLAASLMLGTAATHAQANGAHVYIGGYQGIRISEHTTPFELVRGLPEGEEPIETQAGYHSALALEPDGTLYAEGSNAHGQLGDDNGPSTYTEWVKVAFPTGVWIKSAGVALHTNYAIDTTGQAWEWGFGSEGASCDGQENVEVPTKISSITEATAVSGYEYHVLWLTEAGNVLSCGENSHGQSGQPASVAEVATPTEVPGIAGAVEVAAGSAQSLVRSAGGKVFGFGQNKDGRLCQKKKVENVFGAVEIPLPGVPSEVATGNRTSLFLDEGLLYGCGFDAEGTIGDGSTSDKFALTLATELVGHPLSQVTTGGQESAGISEGEVLTWGSALKGALGNGQSAGFSLTPLEILPGVEVSAVALDVLARA